jgi:hypothetical protein
MGWRNSIGSVRRNWPRRRYKLNSIAAAIHPPPTPFLIYFSVLYLLRNPFGSAHVLSVQKRQKDRNPPFLFPSGASEDRDNQGALVTKPYLYLPPEVSNFDDIFSQLHRWNSWRFWGLIIPPCCPCVSMSFELAISRSFIFDWVEFSSSRSLRGVYSVKMRAAW